MIDWGIGEYEHTAAELAPVAEHVVSLAAPRAGERVVDIACGTGNAALCAARAGAVVVGVDTAARLIEVARERAAREGLEATFTVGDAQQLPFGDGEFDVAVSVFGLIFAGDAGRAFGELVRVLRPGGRAFVSAWVPAGPIDAMVGVFARAIAAATGRTQPRFAWHDREAVGGLAAAHHAEVRFHDGLLSIAGASPESYLAANEERHPMSLAGRPLLEQAGTYAAARSQALAILREGNEDPDRFRVTSPYRVIEVRRPG
ncbi:MAG TPA: class I SAM-dependent methyltransferase [Solirubrobacteraceae bacterium]